MRLPIVGVMGSGVHPHPRQAEALGRWLAGARVHLLTGAGPGVMEAVSRAFVQVPDRCGLSIGIVPGQVTARGYAPLQGYPNPWVEVPVFTHLPLSGTAGQESLSRNHLNVLSATVIVALPGSHGTASEVLLARRYGRPVAAYLQQRDQIPGLPDEVPVYGTLAEITAFVSEKIKSAAYRGKGGDTHERDHHTD